MAMAAITDEFVQRQLLDRRRRLEHAAAESQHPAQVHRLLQQVDAALARMECGSYGICEACHEPVEADRLLADPLVRVCLDHLNESERRALERDLELASQVQRGLLPKGDIVSAGWHIAYHYEPAGIVSGDYCDVVDAAAAGLYFMVGDVSGKGVAASMLMAHVHAMFRALISVGMPLNRMVEHASRVFCESTLPTQYATLFCGRAQADGRVEVCNAGHPPPLVFRDGRVTALEGSDLPVGMFCDEEFAVSELELEPGHSMLIYSDGMSEATDGSGAEYGSSRLLRALSGKRFDTPSALLGACREDLVAFCGGSRRTDDVTMFVLSRAAV